MPGERGGAASSRGRGKFKKYTRGGGKHFSRDLQPVDDEGNAVSMWSNEGQKKIHGEGSGSSSEEESSEEESEEEEEAAGPSQAEAEATREFRKAQKKARKEAAIAKAKGQNVEVGDMPSSEESEEDDDMPANPNHSKAARKQATKPIDSDVEEVTEGVSKMKAGNRKEREALEAAAAKERHMKATAEGKTDAAKADLERLRLIREKREADAQRRMAEEEERKEQEAAKKADIEAREAKRREAAAGPKKGKKK